MRVRYRDIQNHQDPQTPFRSLAAVLTKLSLVAGFAFAVVASLPASTPAQEAAVKVNATVQTFRSTNKEVLYKISYTYEFIGLNAVFIDNVGLVPTSGRLTYFSYDSKIIFRESRAGRVLSEVSLLGPDVYTSVGSGPDFPDESEFSRTYRSGVWASSNSFQTVANEVLNKFFPSGYKAYSASGLNYLQSTYAPLKDLPSNLIGEIAVLVSHPHEKRNKEFDYHIQFVVREKRIQSAKWRYEISEQARKSYEEFIGRLIGKLEEGTKRRQ